MTSKRSSRSDFFEHGERQPALQFLDALFEFALDLVDHAADRGALRRRHLAHPAQERGQLAGAAEHAHAHVLDLLGAGVVAEFGERAAANFFKLFSHRGSGSVGAGQTKDHVAATTWS